MMSWFRSSGQEHHWNGGAVRVFVCSDLHVHHQSNLERIQQWEAHKGVEGKTSVLIVAGDIGTKLSEIQHALGIVKSLYDHEVFVPGNNEVREAHPSFR